MAQANPIRRSGLNKRKLSQCEPKETPPSPPAKRRQPDMELIEDRRDSENSNDSGVDSLGIEVPHPELNEWQLAVQDIMEMIMQSPESIYLFDNTTPLTNRGRGRPPKERKNGVTLCQIQAKLCEYKDPWEFISEVRLVVKEVRAQCSKTSNRSKSCKSFWKMFKLEMKRVMWDLGYCCGKERFITPQKIVCLGSETCMINVNAFYHSYQNGNAYCESCFKKTPGHICLKEVGPGQAPLKVDKNLFVKKKNNEEEKEAFVTCISCERKFHQMCVMHFDKIAPNRFYCSECDMRVNSSKTEKAYTAKSLPTSALSDFIEERVNRLLFDNGLNGYDVMVRVVGTFEREVVVKPGMKRLYVDTGQFSRKFPYRSKTIFVFQSIDGCDVLFLAFIVHEFGSNCPPPNARSVYLAYLDSAQYFMPREPKNMRTEIYREVILRYFEYAGNLGFTKAFIWACPSRDGDDYIFHRKPKWQKIPSFGRLCDWYQGLLQKGIQKGILATFKSYADVEDFSIVTNLPYFEGDHFPMTIEDFLMELDVPKKGCKMGTSCSPNPEAYLQKRIRQEIKKHRKAFFAVNLAQADTPPMEICDPEEINECSILASRDCFLGLARDNRYEFTTLRRAKYLTLVILFNLHKLQDKNAQYFCSICDHDITASIRHHCRAQDKDICSACFVENGMEGTEWELIGFDDRTLNLEHKSRLDQALGHLNHAAHCMRQFCPILPCTKVRSVIHHLKVCTDQTTTNPNICYYCDEAMCLVFTHIAKCQNASCVLFHCTLLKALLGKGNISLQLFRGALARGESILKYIHDPTARSVRALLFT